MRTKELNEEMRKAVKEVETEVDTLCIMLARAHEASELMAEVSILARDTRMTVDPVTTVEDDIVRTIVKAVGDMDRTRQWLVSDLDDPKAVEYLEARRARIERERAELNARLDEYIATKESCGTTAPAKVARPRGRPRKKASDTPAGSR